MKKLKGMSAHRLKDNPEELRFAKAWDDSNRLGKTLAHLLDDRSTRQGYPPSPKERDEIVAATVVQWLGSPVGRGFLEMLGYVKAPPEHRAKWAKRGFVTVATECLRAWDAAQRIIGVGNSTVPFIRALQKAEKLRREALALLADA